MHCHNLVNIQLCTNANFKTKFEPIMEKLKPNEIKNLK